MHEAIKQATGIERANCRTCCHCGTEGDGYEYNGSWPVCTQFDRYANLKSFPFKKEMACWEPDFWWSKFAKLIVQGEDWEMKEAQEKFLSSIENLNTQNGNTDNI